MFENVFRTALLAAAGACAVWAQNDNGKLVFLIPNLYGPEGLKLPNPTHSAHFNSQFQSSFTPLQSALGSELALLPIASPASGFVYTIDPAVGLTRSAQSLGPILSERAETIGRHKLFVALTFQHFGFDSVDGIDLDSVPAVFQHDQVTRQNFERDFITTANSIDLSVNQVTLFGTFGLSRRIDASVALPIVNTRMRVRSDAAIQRTTPPDPVTGQPHYFDPANPENSTRAVFSDSGRASGLGDVVFRLKGTVVKGESSGLALAADVRLPSGDELNLLGSGAWGFKPFVAYSFRTRRVAPHFNLGYEWNGRTVLAGNLATRTKARLPNQFVYAAGVDIGAARWLTLAADLLGQRAFDAPRVFRTNFTDFRGQSFPTVGLTRGSLDIVNGAFGGKIALADRVLVSANLMVRLNDAGLKAKVVPLVGLSYIF